MRKFSLALVFGVLSVSSANASTDVVFACNYGVDLTIDGETHSVSSRSRVRNGSAIPFDFNDHRLELRVTEIDTDAVRIDVLLAEEVDRIWQTIYPEPPHLRLSIGGKTNWTRIDDILQLQLSMICSRFHG